MKATGIGFETTQAVRGLLVDPSVVGGDPSLTHLARKPVKDAARIPWSPGFSSSRHLHDYPACVERLEESQGGVAKGNAR